MHWWQHESGVTLWLNLELQPKIILLNFVNQSIDHHEVGPAECSLFVASAHPTVLLRLKLVQSILRPTVHPQTNCSTIQQHGCLAANEKMPLHEEVLLLIGIT